MPLALVLMVLAAGWRVIGVHVPALSNFAPSDMPGISVFAKDESGAVFRTYATYGRGIDMMNTAHHYLDLVPKGRGEGGQIMAWVKLRDLYDR